MVHSHDSGLPVLLLGAGRASSLSAPHSSCLWSPGHHGLAPSRCSLRVWVRGKAPQGCAPSLGCAESGIHAVSTPLLVWGW